MSTTTTVYTVHDAAELKRAFLDAADGDRIEIAAGATIDSDLRLKGRDFTIGLTITSQDQNNPGVFTQSLELMNVSGITLENFDMTKVDLNGASSLFIRGSENITLKDLSLAGHIPDATDGVDPLDPSTTRNDPIIGYGYGKGLETLGVSNLVIENVEISDFKVGARLGQTTDVTITGLDMHGDRDGILMYDITNMVLEDSYFHDFNPWWNGDPNTNDHSDMIQYWGKHSVSGLNDIIIRDNVFDQGDGWTQTIFGEMRQSGSGVTATGFEIYGNVIVNGHRNGIRLDGVTDGAIHDNLILSNLPDSLDNSRFPRIDLTYATGVTVTDNILVATVVGMTDAETIANGNVTLERYDTTADNYWVNVYDAWRAQGTHTATSAADFLLWLETDMASWTSSSSSWVAADSMIFTTQIPGPTDSDLAIMAVLAEENTTEAVDATSTVDDIVFTTFADDIQYDLTL